jgi:GTPase SAR1 family protein
MTGQEQARRQIAHLFFIRYHLEKSLQTSLIHGLSFHSGIIKRAHHLPLTFVNTSASSIRRAKVVLVGATHVGKTSIVNRFIFSDFTLGTMPTTQPAFSQKLMNHKGQAIPLEIWDTAGQERYHSISPLFYRDAEAGIIVFDITDLETFKKASNWIDGLKQECGDDLM